MWEYKVLGGNDLPSKENLNELDSEGWELIQIIEFLNEMRCAECDCISGGADCNWIKAGSEGPA